MRAHQGTYDIRLALVHARTGQEVHRWADSYTVTDPLPVGDPQMILREAPFPQPGKTFTATAK
jgi:hypothetical protein